MYSKYKKFFINFLIISISIFLLLILTCDLVIRNYNFKKTSNECYWTHVWVTIKREIIKEKSKQGRKLVFLSGSNTLFGVNTYEIERELKIPAVNFGLHAGYLQVIFEEAFDYLNENDIVIMPLELKFFKQENQKNAIYESIAEYVICYNKNMYKKMTLKEKFECIKHLLLIHPFKMETGTQVPDNFLQMIESWDLNPYSPNCWNSNGDIKCERDFQKETFKENIADILQQQDLNKISDKNSYINKFVAKAKDKNIQLYIMPPVIIDSYPKESYNMLYEFYKKLGIPYITDLEDNVYPKEYFYDNNNHLNSLGAHERTKMIIKELKNKNIKL